MHIQRDDGKWLVGPGATALSDSPAYPWRSLAAAMAAIARYRLACAVFQCGDKNAGFAIFY